MQADWSIPGIVKRPIGSSWDYFRDHVFSVRRTIALEADCCSGTREQPTRPVIFRTGSAVDLQYFAGEENGFGEEDVSFCLGRLNSGDTLYIGECDGKPVFSAWLIFHQMDLDRNDLLPVRPDIAYSYKLLTLHHARGLRICSGYYAFLKEKLLETGHTRLVCRIAPSNVASLRAHARAGFLPVGNVWEVILGSAHLFFADHNFRTWLETAKAPDAPESHGALLFANHS